MGYGGSLSENLRLVGVYAGRLLKGEKPADLPVQQSTKVELIINLKTARRSALRHGPATAARPRRRGDRMTFACHSGRAKREPESIAPAAEYGFRVREFAPAPRNDMSRRAFIKLLGGAAAAWPFAARAQQPERMRRIGMLMLSADTDANTQARAKAFADALDGVGWKQGKNIQFEYRWTRGDSKLVRDYAKEIVAMSPDAILTESTQLVGALRAETRTIPVVFGSASDPIESKLADSLARPGGNITGFTSIEAVSKIKYLELLKEFDPRITHVGVLLTSDNPTSANRFGAIAAGGPALNVDVVKVDVAPPADIERAIDAFAARPNGALIILPSALTTTHRRIIIDAAARRRLPTIHPFRYFPEGGCLMSFGADQIDQFRRAGLYVDRILRGEKPGELPIQAPTKFELIINLKTAKALGLDVSPDLLAAPTR